MSRTLHPTVRGRRLPFAALFSVLALLAFGSFPVLAEANPNYEVEQTTLPGEAGGGNPPTHQKNPGGSESSPGAKQSSAPVQNGGTQPSQNGSSKSANQASEGTNPSSPGGSSEVQGQSGKGDASTGKPLGSESAHVGEPKSTSSGSGGSSPLVPILIAIAVLAAISIGVVLFRQRRASPGGMSLKKG